MNICYSGLCPNDLLTFPAVPPPVPLYRVPPSVLSFIHCPPSVLLLGCHTKACPASPAVALPDLLRGICFAERLHLDALYTAALITLGETHMAMGAPRRALQVLHFCHPHALGQCSAAVQGRLHLALSRCLLTLATQDAQRSGVGKGGEGGEGGREAGSGGGAGGGAPPSPLALSSLVGIIAESLHKARLAFEAEAGLRVLVDVFYLQARVFHAAAQLSPTPPVPRHVWEHRAVGVETAADGAGGGDGGGHDGHGDESGERFTFRTGGSARGVGGVGGEGGGGGVGRPVPFALPSGTRDAQWRFLRDAASEAFAHTRRDLHAAACRPCARQPLLQPTPTVVV